jgi:hypothetical protein
VVIERLSECEVAVHKENEGSQHCQAKLFHVISPLFHVTPSLLLRTVTGKLKISSPVNKKGRAYHGLSPSAAQPSLVRPAAFRPTLAGSLALSVFFYS